MLLNAYLKTILQLGDNWALGDEREKLALDDVGQRDDKGQEHAHLEHQKKENLYQHVSQSIENISRHRGAAETARAAPSW
jgi:hypothetical protein